MVETRINAATVVSVFPLEVRERKPGLYPGDFTIPAAKKGDFEILVIGPSSFPVYLDEYRGSLRVPTSAQEVARSIVDDYRPTHLGFKDNNGPGIFWVEGEHTKDQVKAKFADKIKEAEQSQLYWFRELIKISDDLWAMTHKHMAISDLARIACGYLGLEREWQIRADFDSLSVCPACGSEVIKGVAVCQKCRCILDEEKYKKLKFAEA